MQFAEQATDFLIRHQPSPTLQESSPEGNAPQHTFNRRFVGAGSGDLRHNVGAHQGEHVGHRGITQYDGESERVGAHRHRTLE